MAGDHKCPVCSSTFTRPQHVARHMRSHTGDRPYKCTHCGDQFARSDLLSRHVNKCHASEKPATTTQPARRKGHAQPGSSSSGGVRGPAPSLIPPPGARKICDPCAHSRTPAQCDSGFPCGKCLQRNTKCTYVKVNETSHGSVSLGRPPSQDIFAAPPTVPSMAGPRPIVPTGESVFPPQSSFNFTVPIYPQSTSPSSFPSRSFNPEPPQPSAIPDQALAMHSHVLSYPDVSKSATELDAFLNGTSYDNSAANFLYNTNILSQQPQQKQQDIQQQYHNNAQTYGFDQADVLLGTQSHLFGSDYAYAPAHQHQEQQHHQEQQQSQQHSDTSFPSVVPTVLRGPGIPNTNAEFLALNHEGGFSSAFGLMSLDDPAVAAELNKSASFFPLGAVPVSGSKMNGDGTGTGSNMTNVGGFDTSTMHLSMPVGASTPGRDANIAELRDFWKTFMRTPSEQTPGGLSLLNGTAAHSGDATTVAAAAGSPLTKRTLTKMPSMPHIKTPSVNDAMVGRQNGKEDLRSYELAVLARQAPNLKFAPPRRKSTFPRDGAQHAPETQTQQQQQSLRSSPVPPGSTASSPPHGSPSGSVSTTTSASTSVLGSTRATTVNHLAPPATTTQRERPSFKRLASQTLGPCESKSAKVSHVHRADAIAQYESDGPGAESTRSEPEHDIMRRPATSVGRHHHHMRSPSGEYPPAPRDERRLEHRRLSVPTRPSFLPHQRV